MNLNPETITLLAKLFAKEAKTVRDDLEPGKYAVKEAVLLQVAGTVNVGGDYPQPFVNKAKPWSIIYVLLKELNTEREAAGKLGLDMAAVVKMADAIDPKIAKDAEEKAAAEVQALKAPTIKTAKGKVTTKGNVEVAGTVTS